MLSATGFGEPRTMTQERKSSTFDTIDELTQPAKGSFLHRFKRTIQVALIIVSVLGAIPTAVTLYHSVTTGIPFSQVPHRLAQQKMWTALGGCVPSIDFKALTTRNTRVDVGACPDTGDILFRVATQAQGATYEWFPIANLQRTAGTGGTGSLWDWLVSNARADDRAGRIDGRILLAQASTPGIKVKCQAMGPKATMIRVVEEGGACFKETMSLMTGAVTTREPVACDAKCEPAEG